MIDTCTPSTNEHSATYWSMFAFCRRYHVDRGSLLRVHPGGAYPIAVVLVTAYLPRVFSHSGYHPCTSRSCLLFGISSTSYDVLCIFLFSSAVTCPILWAYQPSTLGGGRFNSPSTTNVCVRAQKQKDVLGILGIYDVFFEFKLN